MGRARPHVGGMLRICALFVLFSFPALAQAEVQLVSFGGSFSGPVHVIDGDTVDVGDVRVRIHGIDAPESWQQCQTEFGNNFDCGDLATQQLQRMSEGRFAECVQTDYDDTYNRVVARCYVNNADIGAVMVSEGYALAYTKYSRDYVQTEADAKARDRGLHTALMQDPAWVRQTRAVGRIPVDHNCKIKGNITKNGHIFHVPGQAFYERTGIRPERGERWFCSAQDAIDAGWRAAKR